MADSTIDGLGEYTAAAGAPIDHTADSIAVWDESSSTTKKVPWSTVRNGTFNVKDYGAVGDGVTDDTTAIQNCIDAAQAAYATSVVYFPPSSDSYACNGITIDGNRLSIVAPGAHILSNGVNPLFILAASTAMNNCLFDIGYISAGTGAGVIFDVQGAIRNCEFDIREILQQTNDKPIFQHTNASAVCYFCVFKGTLWEMRMNNSVSAITVSSATNSFSANDFRIQEYACENGYTANAPYFSITSSGATRSLTNKEIAITGTFERCDGGLVHVYSTSLVDVNNVAVWDTGTTTSPLFKFADYGAGAGGCYGVSVRNVERHQGNDTTATAVVDVLTESATDFVIQNYVTNGQNSTVNPRLDANSQIGVTLGCNWEDVIDAEYVARYEDRGHIQQFATFTASAAGPTVARGHNFITANSSPTTITNFNNGIDGQTIDIIVNDANTTFDFTGSNLAGNGGADFTAATNDHLSCLYCSATGLWHCDVSDNSA